MSIRESTNPAIEPLTLAEVKDHLRITDSDSDAMLTFYLGVARRYAEAFTRRMFVQRTFVETFDRFTSTIQLSRVPLVSITSIQYIDTDGNLQSVTNGSPQTYVVDTATEPGRVYLDYGQTWPNTRNQADAVTVTYVAGHATGTSSPLDYSLIPQEARLAILLLIGHWYENRDATSELTIKDVPLAWKHLLHPIRMLEL